MTLFLWIVGGLGFGWYLEYFPGAYASTYGSLSTALIALVFLTRSPRFSCSAAS
jgi:membrane protein